MFECTEPDIVYCSKNDEIIEKAVVSLEKSPPLVLSGGKYPNIDIHVIMEMEVDDFEPVTVSDTKTHVCSIMFTSGTTGIPKGIEIVDNTLKIFPRR